MPLAFFCTLFFRYRKKSVSAPWDGQSPSAPESARHSPPGARGLRLQAHQRAFRSPFGILRATEAGEKPIGLQASIHAAARASFPTRGQGVCACRRTKGLSARPLETFGHRSWREPIGRQPHHPRRSRRVNPPQRGIAYSKVVFCHASRVAFRSPPCTPFGSPPEAIERPIGLQALLPRRSRRVNPRRGLCLPPSLLPFFLLY